MAKSYKELFAELSDHHATGFADNTATLLDAVVYAPANAVEGIHNLKTNMTKKAEVVATTIEAKLLIEKRMLGEMDDSEFAYRLAQDDNVRKMANVLVGQILQPTPLESSPSKTGNATINLAAGLSAYWAAMQQKLPIELENAVAIENVIMNLNAGLDADMEPDTRKLFLKEAGLTNAQAREFVPASAYAEYENKVKEGIRADIRRELGFSPEHELTEEELLLVESMTEERMFSTSQYTPDFNPEDVAELTYEDLYGISAQDMYTLFGEAPGGGPVPDPETWEDVPVDDPEWQTLMEMSGAEDAFWDIVNDTIENNMAVLYELEVKEQVQASDLGLTEEDLAFAGAPEAAKDAPDVGISDADLAFADSYQSELDAETEAAMNLSPEDLYFEAPGFETHS